MQGGGGQPPRRRAPTKQRLGTGVDLTPPQTPAKDPDLAPEGDDRVSPAVARTRSGSRGSLRERLHEQLTHGRSPGGPGAANGGSCASGASAPGRDNTGSSTGSGGRAGHRAARSWLPGWEEALARTAARDGLLAAAQQVLAALAAYTPADVDAAFRDAAARRPRPYPCCLATHRKAAVSRCSGYMSKLYPASRRREPSPEPSPPRRPTTAPMAPPSIGEQVMRRYRDPVIVTQLVLPGADPGAARRWFEGEETKTRAATEAEEAAARERLHARRAQDQLSCSASSTSAGGVSTLSAGQSGSSGSSGDIGPRRLWVVAPHAPEVEGCYDRLTGDLHHQMPVWAGGKRRIYATGPGPGGRWMVTGRTSDMPHNKGRLHSDPAHMGRLMPHDMPRWKRHDGTAWVPDPTVCVTAVAAQADELLTASRRVRAEAAAAAQRRLYELEQRGQLPGALRVRVRQRSEVDGVYVRRRGEVQGGQPVWAYADCRIYSSSNGHWMVAVGLAAVERGAGILSSAAPHGSRMPHEVFDWLVLADDKWMRDESVIIIAEGAATAALGDSSSSGPGQPSSGDSSAGTTRGCGTISVSPPAQQAPHRQR